MKLVLPRFNDHDPAAVLEAWSRPHGAEVEADEVVAVLSTDKAGFELVSPGRGWLVHGAAAGDLVPFGAVLGSVEPAPVGPAAPSPFAPAPAAQPAERAQGSVARAVALSHATIPAAFVLVKVAVDALYRRLDERQQATGAFLGLPEAVVLALGQLAADHPTCLEGHAPGAPVHVGVTFDLGSGLVVPVVRDPAGRGLAAVARDLLGYRMRALRGGFRAEELTGAHLSVSLNRAPGVVLSQPLVLPPQRVMVSVGADLEEPGLDPDGRLVARRIVHLGVAYDHRHVNGHGATALLQALKRWIERAELP